MTLKVEDLSFSFPAGGPGLAGIGFTLRAGDVVCLLGPNGAGKTTLMRCLLGHLPAAGGTVTMPLDKQVWGDIFGMCTDKYGVQWMVDVVAPQG